VLARDRVGIRPLFYTLAKQRLYFASEIKAIFTQLEIERRINIQGLSEIFCYWAPLEPHTVFDGITQLPPGNLLVVERGKVVVSRYWDWSFPEERSHEKYSMEEYAEQLREHLISAVKLRLRADVPVGAYLSGGLDSSIITSLIKNYTDTPLRTFSLEFEDEEFDESKYQTELVRYLKTQHTRILCKKTDIQEVFPRVIWHTESPILRTAPTPLMLLSEEVRRAGYKVVLTGEGSDEVMAGYDIFKEARIRRFWARSPESRLRPRILERLYPYLKYSPTRNAYSQSFFKRGMEYVNTPFFAHVPRWKTTQRTRQFFSDSICNELNNDSRFEDIADRLPAQIMNWQPLNRDQYIEAHTLMSGYLLSSQGDRVALANSVEGRFPFLDHKFIEFASKLPIRYKMMGLNEKFLLKKAMQGLLPEKIRVRTKQPYRAPDSRSFFSNGKTVDYVEDLLSAERIKKVGYFNHEAVAKLVNKCKSEKAIGFSDNMAFVGILSTMLVDDMFLSGTVKTEFKNQNTSNIVGSISNNKVYDIGRV
jgi:asparagine synthase (glutamine-hydrolysing)